MQRHDLLCFARLAVQITRQQVPDDGSKFAPKRSRQPSLLASAPQLQRALGLPTVPDHATLWWFSRHKVKPRLLGRLLTETVRLFQRATPPRSRTAAVDSTGFARAPARPFYQLRAGKRYRARTWLQWSVAVWNRPLGAGWAGCRPWTAWGPCGISPVGGTNAGPTALHAPAGRWGLRFEGQPPLVARRPGHRAHHSTGGGTAIAWYGGTTRDVEVITGIGQWYRIGEDRVEVRWVDVHDFRGTHRDEYCLTTAAV